MAPLIVAEEMRIPGRPTEMFSMFSIESCESGVPLGGVTPALNSAASKTSRYINGMLLTSPNSSSEPTVELVGSSKLEVWVTVTVVVTAPTFNTMSASVI